MKTILILIALFGMASASCYFDASFSRPMCSNNTTLTPQNSTIPSMSYLKTNMTPLIHLNNMVKGLQGIIMGIRPLPSNLTIIEAKAFLADLTMMVHTAQGDFPVNSPQGQAAQAEQNKVFEATPQSNATKVVKNTTKICASSRQKDWESFCMNNMLGSDCFCIGCEKKPLVYAAWNATKNMVMANMESIRGCLYAN